MEWKERIIDTIKGKKIDFLPFIPRLDLWYKSNKFNDTLPEKFKGHTLKEITHELETGFHQVIPDFRHFLDKDSIAFLGLGIYDLKTNPYKINLESIEYEFNTDRNGVTNSLFHTPYGQITTKTLYNKKMESEGITLGHTLEHAIKSPDDLRSIGYLFENIRVEENYKNFLDHKKNIGKDGVSVAFCSLSASPMHHIMKELILFEKFVYELNDHPGELIELSEKIELFFDKIISIANNCQSDLVFCGANYDRFLTWLPFFKRYITPYLKKYSDLAHVSGKFFLTHADGENEGLIGEYLDSKVDVADSICPYPMTKLKLGDIRECFGNNITIWGGLPSICVLEESMSNYEFDKFLDGFFKNLGKGDHIILSFADTTPPDAKIERIEKVAKLAQDFKF